MSPSRSARLESDDDSLRRLAVLIDADNAQASVIDALLTEIAGYGEATVRRIYGDFTSTHSTQWKKVLNQHAIKPVQQFAYTTGKNATDSILIIDAMDLLYTRRFDGFCLVSSDSDFTGLALRIREEGLLVLGFGERKTPDAFRNACHKFVFTEVLRPDPKPAPAASSKTEAATKPAKSGSRKSSSATAPAAKPEPVSSSAQDDAPEFPIDRVTKALDMAADDAGWANLAAFGSYLNKLQPDFDARLYGYRKLSDLVRGMKQVFVVEERAIPGTDSRGLFVRGR